MKNIHFEKISFFFIFIAVLIITDLAGLWLTRETQNKFNNFQTILLLRQKLQQEKVSPAVIKEASLLETVFPNEQEIIQFISNLNGYRNQFDKFLLSFEGGETKGTDLKYLPIVLEITGNGAKINELLDKLWKSSYLLETTSLDLKKDLKSNQTTIVLKANLYVQDIYGAE